MMKNSNKITICDGNTAVAQIAYLFSEVIPIYPITPASSMGEIADEKSSRKEKNIFSGVVDIVQMQSEAGAAGMLHGALAAGSLATTFTASQGLLLMLPNMFKTAGEFLPGVIHVAARSLAYHSLSIFGDHSDVMAARGTGYAMLSSSSVQEAQDMALVAHLAALKSSVPFLHFFDGFRTSHEMQKIEKISVDKIKTIIDKDAIKVFKKRALNPKNPKVRVGAQNPDVYFQAREAGNKFYNAIPQIVEQCFEDMFKITSRRYNLFDYVGDSNATDVIISMGSSYKTISQTVKYLSKNGQKVGAINARLYRPFSVEHLLKCLPKSVKRIAVLDRTKESGSLGEPLFLDVATALREKDIKIIGGRYGLSSKEFTPAMVKGVFEHLKNSTKHNFTVGITDDITNLSIDYDENFTIDNNSFDMKLFGYGSDGLVGASKQLLKIAGLNTNKNVQGYFEYDSKKSGALTVSHIRISNDKIDAPYLLVEPNVVVVSKLSYFAKYDVLKGIKDNGTLIVNVDTQDSLDFFTKEQQKIVKEKNINIYTIDAKAIADNNGIPSRFGNILLTALLNSIDLGIENWKELLNDSVIKTFSSKGKEIVDKNLSSITESILSCKKISLQDTFSKSVDEWSIDVPNDKNTETILNAVAKNNGNILPVSLISHDGVAKVGTTKFEPRKITKSIPIWDPKECIQCGMCSIVCPHAAIRMKQYKKVSLKNSPINFKSAHSMISKEDMELTVQSYSDFCTGCNLCVKVCPKSGKALKMGTLTTEVEKDELENVNFFDKIEGNTNGTNPFTIKGSQLREHYFEFSSSCSGCGETAYIRLITQLFGDRMIIANATGCSSIYGGTYPFIPYTKDKNGNGPAWANSLFEDNAEFALGMRTSLDNKRENIRNNLLDLINQKISDTSLLHIKSAIEEFTNSSFDKEKVNELIAVLERELITTTDSVTKSKINELLNLKEDFIDNMVWCVGGDGWAYDIGFGGLDHVMSLNRNVNILVLDTECYSNTGGQASKATPLSAIAKFASSGKKYTKKNLALMMTQYPNAYVATINLNANPAQALKTIKEATEHDGPSLIIGYSPCIAHGFDMKNAVAESRIINMSGHFPLFRYNPQNVKLGKGAITVDSPLLTDKIASIFSSELRFSMLKDNGNYVNLIEDAKKDAEQRLKMIKSFLSSN